MRKRYGNHVGIQREAGDGFVGLLDRREQIVAAADEREKLAMCIRFDEQTTHGGGEVATAMQTDESVVGNGRVDVDAFAGDLLGRKDEVFQVAGFQTLEDVVGDHAEVVSGLLAIHLFDELRLCFHADHRVLILSSEKLDLVLTTTCTSDI